MAVALSFDCENVGAPTLSKILAKCNFYLDGIAQHFTPLPGKLGQNLVKIDKSSVGVGYLDLNFRPCTITL